MKKIIKGLFVGLATYDIVVSSNENIVFGKKIDADSIWKGSGGPATNAAIAFKQLGGESHLISRIGNSSLGVLIKEELKKIGVSYTDLEDENSVFEPPISFITVNDEGEKTIVSAISKSNNELFDFDSILKIKREFDVLCYDKHLGIKQHLFLDYFMDIPRVYDPGRPSKIAIKLLEYADHIIAPNFSEYFSLMDSKKNKVKLYAISKGANDIIVYKSIKESVLIHIEKVKVVDTMGAGDILHGAYAYEIAKGNSILTSLKKASKIATKSTTHWGARIIID